jgi:cytosine/uracil/thiamine/allantoin permease
LFESLNKIGLVKRFDATLRLWINTGTVNINLANPATNCAYNLIPSNNTFSNTCPLMVNYHAGGTGTSICPAGTQPLVLVKSTYRPILC